MADAWLAIHEGLTYPFAQRALLASVLAAVLAGPVGVLLLVRRQAMLGDAASHATLPGIAIALALPGGVAPVRVLIGAILAAGAGTVLALWLGRGARARAETGLAVGMTAAYGAGLLLWALLSPRFPMGSTGVRALLIGNPAGLTRADVVLLATLTAVALGWIVAARRRLEAEAFDARWARSAGIVGRGSSLLPLLLLAATVVVLGRSMGVLLVTGLLVLPAQAALLHARSLRGAWVGAVVAAVPAAVAGDLASLALPGVPTGPAIVLAAGLVFLGSAAWAWMRRRRRHAMTATVTARVTS